MLNVESGAKNHVEGSEDKSCYFESDVGVVVSRYLVSFALVILFERWEEGLILAVSLRHQLREVLHRYYIDGLHVGQIDVLLNILVRYLLLKLRVLIRIHLHFLL